jgi:hypothetical protein
MFTILHKIINIYYNEFYTLSKGHQFKLTNKPLNRYNVHPFSFACRRIDCRKPEKLFESNYVVLFSDSLQNIDLSKYLISSFLYKMCYSIAFLCSVFILITFVSGRKAVFCLNTR